MQQPINNPVHQKVTLSNNSISLTELSICVPERQHSSFSTKISSSNDSVIGGKPYDCVFRGTFFAKVAFILQEGQAPNKGSDIVS